MKRLLPLLLLLLGTCTPRPGEAPKAPTAAPPPAGPEVQAPGPQAPVAAPAPAQEAPATVQEAPAPPEVPTVTPSPEPDPRLKMYLSKVLERQTCNRVNNCPASQQLCKAGALALPLLDEALAGPEAKGWQRCRLYWILGCIGGEEARTRLLSARQSETPECRLEALLGLARIADPREQSLFAQTAARAGADQLAAAAAAWGLGRQKDPSGAAMLLELLAKAPSEVNPGAVTIAMEAVVNLRLVDVCPLLGPYLQPRELFSLRATLTAVERLACPGYEAQLKELETAPWPSAATHASRLLKRLQPKN